MTLNKTWDALSIRTNVADAAVWQRLLAILRNPPEPFVFGMNVVDDPERSDSTVS